MMINCKYNLVCDRSNCKFHHDTIDGKSPIINHCFFNYDCKRPECNRIHSTLDGRSPSFVRPHAKKSMDFVVDITTWNVLLDNLGLLMEKNYPLSVLDPEVRWKKIIDILMTFMVKGHIICLQEVTSRRIEELLIPLCQKYSYSIIGGENCIMIPHRFIIVDSNWIRIGRDTVSNESKYLPHTMYSALLLDTKSNQQLYVATYHMPCKYKRPDIMQAHLQQIMKILECASFPVIFAGDMNMLPNEIRTGSGISSVWDYGPVMDTTFAYIFQEFRACIDNIFFSKDSFVYNGVNISPPTCLIPDKDHPSDHVPLTCSLIMK